MIFALKCTLLFILIISIALTPIICIFSNRSYTKHDKCYDGLEGLGFAKGGVCKCPIKSISDTSLCKTCPYQK